MKKKLHLEMRNLKQTELQRLTTKQQRKERLRITRKNKIKRKLRETAPGHSQNIEASLGDDNELERNLRLEKVVASKQLRLAMETEEERRARLENDAAMYQMAQVGHGDGRRKKTKTGEMVATAQLMLALIKGVVDVGVILSLKSILKSWQLCLSFKLDVLTT